MRLLLFLTARCNAACLHCSTNCGPGRVEALSREKICSLMDEAAALSVGETLKFGLTGGEPFLDFPLLLDVVAHGKSVGAKEITCVTNAYWATSPDKARQMLGALKQAGLTGFGISTSRFHREFVKLQRVERALEAARDVGLPVGLKHVRNQSDAKDDAAIESWARLHGAWRVEMIDLLPSLRDGATLPDSHYARRPGLPEDPCPAAILSIREDGRAYTCGAPGGGQEFLELGSVRETSLEGLRDRLELGGRQQLLRARGPAFFAQAAIAAGHGDKLRTAYSDVCDLCTHIAQQPTLAAIAAQASRAFEVQQFGTLLENLGRSRG